jgi:hypothetical protein
MNQGDRVENAPARHRAGWGWFFPIVFLSLACQLVSLPALDNTAARLLGTKSGLIAYIGLDGNVYTIDQYGGNQMAITTDARLPAGEKCLTRFIVINLVSDEAGWPSSDWGADNQATPWDCTGCSERATPVKFIAVKQNSHFIVLVADSQQVASWRRRIVTWHSGDASHRRWGARPRLEHPFVGLGADNRNILIHTGSAADTRKLA